MSSNSVCVSLSVCASTLFSVANSHGWLHCSDYDGVITGQDYDDSLCNGYVRDWAEFEGQPKEEFGVADQRGSTGGPGNWCPAKGMSDPLLANYNDRFPFATYYIGDMVTLVWPAKNHAMGDGCGSMYTTDAGMRLYVNPTVNPESDPDNLDDWNLIIDWHEEDGTSDYNLVIEGRPYSNCPKYCEDTDKAACFGMFEIKAEDFTQSGYYTFMWYWNFGSPFTTCYEAYVDVTDANPNPPDTQDTQQITDTSAGVSDSSEEDESSAEQHYDAWVTVCYQGAAYDENEINEAMSELYEEYEWTIEKYNEISNVEFNVTLKVLNVEQSSLSSISDKMSDGTLCDEILDQYDGDEQGHVCSVECSLGVYVVQVDNSNFSQESGNDSDEYRTGVIVALVVVVLAILGVAVGGFLYKRHLNKKHKSGPQGSETIITDINNVNATQDAAAASASATAAAAVTQGGATQTNIVPVSE